MTDGVMSWASPPELSVYAISKAVISMQNYVVTLDHLGYISDLEAVHTLEDIVRCMPPQLQSPSVEAEATRRGNRKANFQDPKSKSDWRTEVVHSSFGHIIRDSIG